MASLHPVSVIAQQLFKDDAQRQYQRPAVTTRQSAVRPYAAPAQASEPRSVRPVGRPSLVSRLAHVVVHPLSVVRSH